MPNIYDEVLAQLAGGLYEATDQDGEDSPELLSAKANARAGDPTDLIRLCWPDLIVTEEEAGLLGRNIRVDTFQIDLIGSITDEHHREVYVKGCTSAGKGCSIAMAVVLYYLIYPESCIILASTTYDHAIRVIWGEVRRWYKACKIPIAGKLLQEGAKDHDKHYISVANPDKNEGFAGTHSENVLFVIDEATSMKDSRFKLTLTQAHKIVAAGNPQTMSGWFRDGFPKDDPDRTRTVAGKLGPRRTITIGGLDCANVRTGNDKLIPGQIEKFRYDAMCQETDKRWVACFADGKFPDEDATRQVIPGSFVDRAVEAYTRKDDSGQMAGQLIHVNAFGLDIAASDLEGDKSVLSAGGLQGCKCQHEYKIRDTMQLTGIVLNECEETYGIDLTRGQNPITVDTDGIGKGVADRLEELGVWVIRHIGSGRPLENPERYVNMRAESYGKVGERLDPNGMWPEKTWMLPPSQPLKEELVTPEKVFQSEGFRFKITPKDSQRQKEETTVRSLIGRSPDRGDSLCYLYVSVREFEEKRYASTRDIVVACTDKANLAYTGQELHATMETMDPDAAELLKFCIDRGALDHWGKRMTNYEWD